MDSSIRTATGGLRRVTHEAMGAALPACLSLGSAASAEGFVTGILLRHAAARARMAPLELTLLAHRGSSITNIYEMLTTLAIRPSFVMRVVSAPRASAGARPSAAAPVSLHAAPDPTEASATRMHTFERIFARERRIEAPHVAAGPQWAISPAGRLFGAPQAAAPRLPGSSLPDMILRRNAAAPSPRPEGTPHADRFPALASARHTSVRGPAASQPIPASLPLSSSELRHLTDQVVGAIDRRIIAQRERRGAI